MMEGLLETSILAIGGPGYRYAAVCSDSLDIALEDTPSLYCLMFAIGGPIFFFAVQVHRRMIIAACMCCETSFEDTM
jgi:hypothetical protein